MSSTKLIQFFFFFGAFFFSKKEEGARPDVYVPDVPRGTCRRAPVFCKPSPARGACFVRGLLTRHGAGPSTVDRPTTLHFDSRLLAHIYDI